MKLNRKSFLEALTAAASVINKKSPQPILADVMARVVDGGLEIVGTDLRTTVATVIGCEDPEAFCAPADDLRAMVAALGGEDVAVKAKDGKLLVSSGGAKFTLSTDNPRDFPEVASFNASSSEEVDASAIAYLLAGVTFAASLDGTRLNIANVRLACAGGVLESSAVDGHRLAVMRLPGSVDGIKEALLSVEASKAIQSLIDGSDKCKLAVDGDVIHVRCGGSTVSAKLVEAKSPPFEQFVAPSTWSKSPMIFDRETMAAAIRRSLAIRGTAKSGDQDGTLTMTLGKLRISREESEKSVEESITVDCNHSSVVTCNLTYLAEALAHINGEDLEWHNEGELDPIKIRSKDGMQIQIVMPKRL
jgi:DNA polymerase-3 subunit beta